LQTSRRCSGLAECVARFALEYAATQKSFARYEKIHQEIESDATLDTFLYLTPSFDLLRTLTPHLCSSKKRIVFGLLSAFKKQRWDTTVYYADFVSRALRQVLAPNAANASM
jgi:hypothetical protein